MTSMINGLVPTGPPDPVSKAKLPEKKSGEKVDNSRFKESLDKAISGEKEVRSPEGRNIETPVKEKMGEKGKKKVSPSKRLKITSVKETGIEVLAMLVPEQTKIAKAEQIAVKSELKTLNPASDVRKSRVEQPAQEGEEKNTVPQKGEILEINPLINSESEVKEENPDKMESKQDDEALIIPFPGGSENSANEVRGEKIQVAVDTSEKPVKGVPSAQKKGKDEPVLTVVDTRSKNTQEVNTDRVVTKSAQVTESVDATVKDNSPIVLGEQNIERVGGEETKTFESRFNESREVLLTRELKESGNDQIVKKASFVLKDNNQGEIKLILKPEALGRVKIHLNMNENNLVGKIIVENSRVGQVFENNLNNLSKAFEEAGISSSSLEVSVGDEREQYPGEGQFNQKEQPYYSERLKTFDQAVPTVNTAAERNSDRLINLVV